MHIHNFMHLKCIEYCFFFVDFLMHSHFPANRKSWMFYKNKNGNEYGKKKILLHKRMLTSPTSMDIEHLLWHAQWEREKEKHRNRKMIRIFILPIQRVESNTRNQLHFSHKTKQCNDILWEVSGIELLTESLQIAMV